MSELDRWISVYEEKKKFAWVEIKACNEKTAQILFSHQLKNLKEDIWHEVQSWENLWRLTYEHVKVFWSTQINSKRLKGIILSPWDKIYFSKNYIYIEYKSNSKKYEIIPLGDKCEWGLRRERQSEGKKKLINQNIEKNSSTQTIFDVSSPFAWDKLAYEREIKIREKYGNMISNLIEKYGKWSVVNESLLYAILARESRFDPNAKSYTWVRWLAQITEGTIQTLINIWEAKMRNNENLWDLYVTNEIKLSSTKNKDWFYLVDMKKALKEENQIKLSLSYLFYLEGLFDKVKDSVFKRDLIIFSYNLWQWRVEGILKKYTIRNTDDFKYALFLETQNGKITQSKHKEVRWYIKSVKENIILAQG